MSSAFVREGDSQQLHEIAPTMHALQVYLQRENGGIRIYEKKQWFSEKQGRDVFEMSDGLIYAKDDDSKWYIVFDE
ncbi:hypothetical protein [Mucilaginibacter sp. KACC 22063]|uniref:hypothetical protein n=1 Tax=Mucilaginibacter sp. KACC 22063 TaxID=3025666 RepID=UPI0023661DAF|nr:hypothetical protein [Mucilaginibacter sp. KACC 22063]WDF54303.1 hypothetical protein PQ461_15260 [Mucilaginibacter sp. KACC 22063]